MKTKDISINLEQSYQPETTIWDTVEEERHVREPLNAKWLEMWHLYKTQALKFNVDGEWHSKLNDGRVFEVVETVGSYIRNALFFSEQWLSLEAQEPGLAEIVPLVNAYIRDCLNNSNLKREFRVYITQLLLLGSSAMSVQWDDDAGLVFETLSMLDTYVESGRRFDERFSYSFRERYLNYAEFLLMFDSFNELETEDPEEAFCQLLSAEEDLDSDRQHMRDVNERASERVLKLVEYYEPIDKRLTFLVNNICVGSKDIDYCPWLFSTLYELPETTYGMSVVDSSIGLILENNVLMNRRLDNVAVSVDNMWLFVDDGVTNPEDIKTAPGKVIVVGRPDSIQPMHPPNNNFNISYTEAQVLDTKIDRNIGTGAMISANAYRTGERVTATEIQSVKDAGGNRLTDLYEHIEANCILPILYRAYEIIRKHTKSSKVVKLPGKGEYADYFQMLPEDLKHDYRVRLRATQSVINRDRNIQQLTEFVTLVAQVPQFAERLNYDNLFYDLLFKFGFDNPSRYVAAPEEPAPQQQTPLQSVASTAEEIAPGIGAATVQGAVAGGEMPQMMMDMAGAPPSQEPIDPELEQQIMAAMSMPV